MNLANSNTLDYKDLKEILPQAFPFLMIDRVVDYEVGKSLTAIKNVTSNEWFFEDSENNSTTLPETLLIEAASQAALVIYHLSKVKDGEKVKYLLGRIKAEFYGSAAAGDTLEINVDATKMLDTGGYSDIKIKKNKHPIADVFIAYSVIR